MSAREREAQVRPPAASRAHLFVGGGLLCAAAAIAFWQAPRAGMSAPRVAAEERPAPERAPGPAGSPSEPRLLAALGPIRTGEVLGDGWRVERIEDWRDEVRMVVAHGGRGETAQRVTLGLAAPGSRAAAAIVPMPDLYVWYSSQSNRGEDLGALIQALAARLREAAEGQPLYARVLAWARAAPEAAP